MRVDRDCARGGNGGGVAHPRFRVRRTGDFGDGLGSADAAGEAQAHHVHRRSGLVLAHGLHVERGGTHGAATDEALDEIAVELGIDTAADLGRRQHHTDADAAADAGAIGIGDRDVGPGGQHLDGMARHADLRSRADPGRDIGLARHLGIGTGTGTGRDQANRDAQGVGVGVVVARGIDGDPRRAAHVAIQLREHRATDLGRENSGADADQTPGTGTRRRQRIVVAVRVDQQRARTFDAARAADRGFDIGVARHLGHGTRGRDADATHGDRQRIGLGLVDAQRLDSDRRRGEHVAVHLRARAGCHVARGAEAGAADQPASAAAGRGLGVVDGIGVDLQQTRQRDLRIRADPGIGVGIGGDVRACAQAGAAGNADGHSRRV